MRIGYKLCVFNIIPCYDRRSTLLDPEFSFFSHYGESEEDDLVLLDMLKVKSIPFMDRDERSIIAVEKLEKEQAFRVNKFVLTGRGESTLSVYGDCGIIFSSSHLGMSLPHFSREGEALPQYTKNALNSRSVDVRISLGVKMPNSKLVCPKLLVGVIIRNLSMLAELLNLPVNYTTIGKQKPNMVVI